MKKLPNTLWNQFNRGDTILGVFNTLKASFNLDLTTVLGKTRTSRMLQTTTSATNTAMTGPAVGFKFFNTGIYTAAGTGGVGQVHSNAGSPELAFTAIGTGAGKPVECDSEYSDIEFFGTSLFVSSKTTKVWYSSDGTSWTNTINVGTANVPHMFCVFGGRMYYTGSATIIYSWSEALSPASPPSQYAIEISNNFALTFIRATSNRIFFGTINTRKGKAFVYEWDGASAQPSKSYKLDATGALACVVKDDVPYVMDTNGRLLKWNGGTFLEVARLPINNKYLKNPNSLTNNRFIHPNGMTVVDGKINLLIDNGIYDSGTPINEFCPSGIWEYDEQLGLYHKNSLSLTASGGTLRDWGQNRLAQVGGLSDMKIDSTSATKNGDLLAGATVYTNATATANGIYTNDQGTTYTKSGYLITPEFAPSSEAAISSMWQKFYLSIMALKNLTDTIVVKYRTTKAEPTEITATLASGTTFTTTDANMANYVAGDEIEVTRGDAGGLCAHITAIALNAGTYTVTIDQTFPNTGVTALLRLQKWIKLGTISSDIVTNFKDFVIGKQNNWIQFKVYFLWAGNNEFVELAVADKPYKSIE